MINESTGYYCFGKSDFARAVSESGFGRVCPRCYQQWSDKRKFMLETKLVGTEVGIVKIKDLTSDEIIEIRCPKQIYEHHCGGQMFIDIPERELKKAKKIQ